jgi:hypothetical protein
MAHEAAGDDTRASRATLAAVAAALTLCLFGIPTSAQQPTETFRTGVELLVVRVQVRASREQPLPPLTTSNFTFRIGKRTPARRASSVDPQVALRQE